LFSKQYREKSHYCLYVALKALFVDSGILEEELSEFFYGAMILRENADYRSEFSKTRATKVIEKAEYFLGRAREILK